MMCTAITVRKGFSPLIVHLRSAVLHSFRVAVATRPTWPLNYESFITARTRTEVPSMSPIIRAVALSVVTCSLLYVPARAADPAIQTSITISPKILALAKQWFFDFRSGKIDRSKLDVRVNRELTDELIRKESATLKTFGKPIKFVFFGSNEVQYAVGYNFGIEFKNGRVIELIAFDPDGKIAGIDFQTFVSDHDP